ncbi:MAG: FAD-dependent oxidoreductase [Anaerolineae bacterium]
MPLRVAIIGSGPSGFYAAEYLQKQANLTVQIDMFDRLPTPFGLVRGGVAPDHQKIKSVTKVYDKIAAQPNFRFYGNVTFGVDITYADLVEHYHAIIYAVGAQTDRNLDIPGEHLPGSHAATAFVGWYNGHPDYRHLEFDLTQDTAVVVGVGNVAMDVARILGRSQAELATTDIADYALEALAKSNIKTIYVLGRRGAAQAAFTNPEIKELGELEEVDMIVAPDDANIDELSKAAIADDRSAQKNVEILQAYAHQTPAGRPKRIVMRFLVSPVEILGTDHVEAVKIVKNELYQDERGGLRPRPTDQTETIPAGLVFRSVGYQGVPLPDVPFYERWGVIPNEKGRVLKAFGSEERLVGSYAVGWIKRGPSGIIGTNKPDSVETAQMLVEDAQAGQLLNPGQPDVESIPALLHARGVRYVTFADWQIIDELEQARGQASGRPRVKFVSVEDMLDALEGRKATSMGD